MTKRAMKLTDLLPAPTDEEVAKVWICNNGYEVIEEKIDVRYARAKTTEERKRIRRVYDEVLRLRDEGFEP